MERSMIVMLLLLTQAVSAEVFYLDDQDCSDNYDGTRNQPWCTFSHAFDQMDGGDTLMIKDGIYINNILVDPPSGYEGSYTTIRAENPGEVMIDDSFVGTSGYPYTVIDISTDYIMIDGINARNGESVLTVSGNNIIIRNSGFSNADSDDSVVVLGGTEILMEDCWVWGSGNNMVYAGGSTRGCDDGLGQDITFRRVIVRNDLSESSGGDSNGFLFYGADNIRVENCIVLDVEPAVTTNTNKYRNAYRSRDGYCASNHTYLGSIALNMPEDVMGNGYEGFELSMLGSAENCVAWDIFGTGFSRRRWNGDVYMDHVTAGESGYGASTFNQPTKNSLFVRNADEDLADAHNNHFFEDVPQGTSYETGDPDLRHIVRIEDGSLVKDAADDGGDIGANIVYLYHDGVLTDTPLWPWPNEDRIMEDMCEDVTRGFCEQGNGLYGGPRTLTSYIWEYNGHACPEDICLGSVRGNTYYLSTDGDDSNDGLSEDTPWQSLYKASTSLIDGDQLLLKRGDTWYVTHNKRDSEEIGMGLYIKVDDIQVSAYGTGNNPVIDATAQSYEGDKRSTQAYSPIEIGVRYGHASSGVTISDIDLRGPHLGSALQTYSAGDDTTIVDCDISGSGWSAESLLYAGSGKISIINNSFDAIVGTQEPYSKSIEINGGSDHLVSGNTFRGYGTGGALRFSNHGTGAMIEKNFFYEPDTRSEWAWAIVVRSCDGGTYIIRNNIFDMTDHEDFSGTVDLRGIASWYDYSPTTRLIYNNIFVSNDGHGAAVEGMGGSESSVEMHNNIIIGVDVGFNNDNARLSLENNIFHECDHMTENGDEGTNINNEIIDPLLANPSMSNHAPADAMISSTSAAINSGKIDQNVPVDDFFGNQRDSFPDIGPFESMDGTCEPIHSADINPCDGRLSPSEFMNFILSWISGSASMQEILEAIVIWKG